MAAPESDMEDDDLEREEVADRVENMEPTSDLEEEQFDITLPPSHSYLSASALLEPVSGRAVLEAGWTGRVPCLAHHSVVFPGETVPVLLLPAPHHASAALRRIRNDRLFGLLCPDESGSLVSDYGVVCEVLEVAPASPLGFKARAHRRFRLRDPPRPPPSLHHADAVQLLTVCVLPDVLVADPLRGVRLASLDARRAPTGPLARHTRRLDATLTPWPPFVYDMFDSERLETIVRRHFEDAVDRRLPTDLVSLSFWAASNLVVPPRDRFALFVVDDVLQRLHMLVQHIAKRRRVVCCAACGVQVAQLDHAFAMSSEGLHATFCNVGGHLHDVMTVSEVTNVVLTGGRSEEFSWFPGYAWSIAVCAMCVAHIGWRFDACKRGLRPQNFWAICRNYVQPRDIADSAD